MNAKKASYFYKIDVPVDPLVVYRAMAQKKPAVLLESARISAGSGRYSLVVANPQMVFWSRERSVFISRPGAVPRKLTGEPFNVLRMILKKYAFEPSPGSAPFAGGAVGFVSYEAKNLLEPSCSGPCEDLGLPWLYFPFFNSGVLFDHKTNETFFFSKNRDAALARSVRERILRHADKVKRNHAARSSSVPHLLMRSSVSRQRFLSMVRKAKEYIRRGDIYQANLSQRFSFPLSEPVETVYEKLKKVNPSSFFGILDAGDYQILSGSPERLLRLEGRRLETRPIAGTRSRSLDPRQDRKASIELLLSEKERAEHIMLVDLERNDLGRVAEYGSVTVDELMEIEEYSHVKHIVSNVRATLKKGLDAVDAFTAFFPGGTITGAPKIRSMQVIDELEPVARGPYTGSMGYFSFTGGMDFNIIIRSLVIKDGTAHLQVGAGIVADSNPQKEYDETLYKAEAVLAAIFGPVQTRRYLDRLRTSLFSVFKPDFCL